MQNLSPAWRTFLKNLGWYAATVVALIIMLTFFRFRYSFALLMLWAVGLGWGGVLAYQFSRLLFKPPDTLINEGRVQTYLEQAQTYKTRLDEAVRANTNPANQIHMEQLARQIETWTAAIASLGERLNNLRLNEVISRDLREVPKAITDLQNRLAQTTDPALKAQLERTLSNRQKQWAALTDLQNTMQRAEFQIESTLSMLGTIYSQLLTGQSTSHVADYSRLSAEVAEEVRLLQDHLAALREVKLGGT